MIVHINLIRSPQIQEVHTVLTPHVSSGVALDEVFTVLGDQPRSTHSRKLSKEVCRCVCVEGTRKIKHG